MTTTTQSKTYQATGTPRRLVHHNFFVGSIAKTMDFYNQVLGIEETFRIANRGAGFLSNGNTHHDLGFVEVSEVTRHRGEEAHARGIKEVPLEYGTKPGLNHFAYEMHNEAELVAAYDRISEFGVKPWLLEDRIVTRSVYFSDPEGNGVEYTVDMLSNWRDYRKAGATISQREYVPGKETPSTTSFVNLNPEIRRVESGALHAKRSSHCTIVARDFSKLRRFYIDVVGLREVYHSPSGEFSLLHGKDYPGYSTALVAHGPNRPAGVGQICFELAGPEDFANAEKRLAAKSVKLELRIEHPKKQVLRFRDPDGTQVQCYVEAPDFLDAVKTMDPALVLQLV